MSTAVERMLAERGEQRSPSERPASHGPRTSLPGMVAAGAVLGLAVWAVVDAFTGHVSDADVARAIVAVAWAGAGALLVRRDHAQQIAAIAFGAAALGACAQLVDAMRPVAAGLLPAAGLHLLLAYPDALGRRSRRGVAIAGYVIGAGVAAGLFAVRPSYEAWPVGAEIALFLLMGTPATFTRYPKLSGPPRKRMEWLGWSITLTTGVAIVLLGLRALVDWPPSVGLVIALSTVLIPAAIAASTSRRLAGVIDVVLTSTISLAGLTAVVVGIYLAIVLGLGRVPRHSERTLLVLSMASAGLAALLYLPAHRRLREFATRLVYGERSAPDDVIRNFGQRLSRSIPLDELLLQMAESLRKTLGLSSAEVWRASGGTLELAVSDPERAAQPVSLTAQEEQTVARAGVSGPAWAKVWLAGLVAGREDANLRVAPVTYSGELLGLIVVQRPDDTEAYVAEDERVLAELARQVGVTFHNVRLDSALQASLDEVRRQAQALQESRARIVAAGDLERRKIERNLHDGAQQHLVALAVKVRLARQLADRDPAKSQSMLEELASDVEETLQELRDLAHGIYPPLLADKGLPEALASAARRSMLPVSVDAAGVERYPADAEAAVYFCCLEALQNAGKYAGEGAEVRIRVWHEAGGLLFEVADTGAGFDVATRSPGAGFTNMSDRLGAIGGTLRVESAPGRGTTVRGTIPLAVSAEPST